MELILALFLFLLMCSFILAMFIYMKKYDKLNEDIKNMNNFNKKYLNCKLKGKKSEPKPIVHYYIG